MIGNLIPFLSASICVNLRLDSPPTSSRRTSPSERAVTKGRANIYLPNTPCGGRLGYRPVSYEDLGLSPVFGETVAFLECYFDESIGSHGDLIVAGYASGIDHWAAFATAWRECLSEYGVPYFHMRKLKSPQSSLFRHLSWDQRRKLFTKLLWLIHSHVMLGVSCRIKQSDYESITTPLFRTHFGSTYAFAVQMCTLVIDRFLNGAPGDDHKFSVFLESGYRNAEEALAYLREEQLGNTPVTDEEFQEIAGTPDVKIFRDSKPPRVRIDSVGLGTKQSKAPLQAADILAHCTLNSDDVLCGSGLDVLKETTLHRGMHLTPEVIYALALTVVEGEERRMVQRQWVHNLSRVAGWGGWKIKSVPGGLLIDGRNPTPVDFERMIKSFEGDPNIKMIHRDKEQ